MPAGPHQIKCTDKTLDAILASISRGIPYKKACLSKGVSERLFYIWLQIGEEDIFNGRDTKHSSLVRRLNEIEEKRIQYNLERVEEQENGHKGAQWILERVFWKYFSPKIGEIELNERVEALEKQKGNTNDDKNKERKDDSSEG